MLILELDYIMELEQLVKPVFLELLKLYFGQMLRVIYFAIV